MQIYHNETRKQFVILKFDLDFTMCFTINNLKVLYNT